MAGSIALSLTQRYDKSSHIPLDGGLLYFYAAGTTTPQSAYQDISLTIPWPNPMTLDSGGNVPQLFFADGYIKFRLANSAGVTQIAADFVLVLGPSSGGGAAPSVDPTTILQTGWLQPIYGAGVVSGFVRCNKRTIGNAASGATERANADTAALFSFLYQQDVNLAVSGGRGANAATDYAANKTITLPDGRGRIFTGLADMGSSTSPLLDGVSFNSPGSNIILGSTAGASFSTLAAANLPPYTPAGAVGVPTVAGLGGAQAIAAANGSIAATLGAGGTNVYPANQMGSVTSGAFVGTAAPGQISAPLQTISAILLVTVYLKL